MLYNAFNSEPHNSNIFYYFFKNQKPTPAVVVCASGGPRAKMHIKAMEKKQSWENRRR